MLIPLGCFVGFLAWFIARYLVAGLYTVNQNERAVKTSFGRAERVGTATTLDDPISEGLTDDEKRALRVPAGARDPAGRAVLQVAVGEGLQGLDRHRRP